MGISPELLVEMFPVNEASIPPLFAYGVDAGRGETKVIGGRLAYQLKHKIGGRWVWSHGRLISDQKRETADLMKIVSELWKTRQDQFRSLKSVYADPNWKPNPSTIADFAARGLVREKDPEIRTLLAKHRTDLGNVFAERIYEARGWTVEGKPAVSLSLFSRLVHRQDLRAFAKKASTMAELKGLWVADKTSSLKGEIVEIVGRLGEERARLRNIQTREEMMEIVDAAPDDELVVSVSTGRDEYDYPASALDIIVHTSDLGRFSVDPRKALRALKIEPQQRHNIVTSVANIVHGAKLLDKGYDSPESRSLFLNGAMINFTPTLRFGGDHVEAVDPRSLSSQLHRHGLYRIAPQFVDKPIRLGVINAVGEKASPFFRRLSSDLRSLKFSTEVVHEVRPTALDRASLERAVDELQKAGIDFLLALLPEDYEDDDDEEWGAYQILKQLTIGPLLPSQVVYEATLTNEHALTNISLGILGKTGNIPFVLGKPLDYADVIVGIDVARERKRRLAGSMNTTAIARIHMGNGDFLRYMIHDAPLEGEELPEHVIQAIFPSKEFAGKRVIVHRDGYFRGNEKAALRNWGAQIGATFELVEIIKTGTPRLYGRDRGTIIQPPKASVFRLSDHEAFLVSSLPPFKDATPAPLRVTVDGTIGIDKAIHSILSLTLLHYGSLRQPRLPVTTHYSDRIAYLALRGIKPKQLEGTLPFWL